MTEPHGGKLINKIISKNNIENLNSLEFLILNNEQTQDTINIATGVYSPIIGFLGEQDFNRVVVEMRLNNGLVWSIPIILDVSEQDHQRLKNKNKVLLKNTNQEPLAILENIEIFPFNKTIYSKLVFGTLDRKHPGVESVYQMGNYLIGGEIYLLNYKKDIFPDYNLTPEETRKNFNFRGWNKIVAFQTRNVPHCGHEFLQKHALQQVDGLFIQPVIGEKKADDFKDEQIISSYEILIDKYFPKNKAILGILPLKMRYAGPREAIFHALIRKNYGCSHFIVGRDHAGVGNFYKPFEAQEIFEQFEPGEIGIEILKYPEVVFDKINQKHCFIHECAEENRENFSGTKLRQHIQNKTLPPLHMIRPEIYNHLTQTDGGLVEKMQNDFNGKKHQGFVLWLTGLSQSGKSTIADKIYDKLINKGIKAERLDGDIVREYLCKDLKFSKQDRYENVRRVGFVAKLLSRNGIAVIASFISPYKQQRDDLRLNCHNYIEIFIDTPVEVCEKRDTKGVYAKARKGEIPNFTGISDPYQAPENPEIYIKNNLNTDLQEQVEKIIKYLEDKQLI